VGQQLSVRGGTVGVEVRDDRVTLTGRAVTIIEGDLVARNGG
jgi:diaminopimelate epimerase